MPHTGARKGVLGSLGSLGLIAFVVYFKVSSATPSWETVNDGTLDVPGDQAYILEYRIEREGQMRVTATEATGKPLLVYWVSTLDHHMIQGETEPDPAFVQRVRSQCFLTEQASATATQTIPPGNIYLYIEAVDTEPTKVDYQVELFQ